MQKPFTADELADFVNKLLVKRLARLEALRQPLVRIVSPSQAEGAPSNEFCVPGGAFIAAGHTWARIEPEGQVRIGIDDFAHKALGTLGQIVLPLHGQELKAGDVLFSVKRGQEVVTFKAPVSGRVIESNQTLDAAPDKVNQSPYKEGWVCRISPSDLKPELTHLLIGKPVVAWYGEEIKRLRDLKVEAGKPADPLEWSALQQFMV